MVWGHVKQIPSKVNIISSIITLPKPKLPLWEPAFQNYLPLIVLKSVDGTKHDKHTYLNMMFSLWGLEEYCIQKTYKYESEVKLLSPVQLFETLW